MDSDSSSNQQQYYGESSSIPFGQQQSQQGSRVSLGNSLSSLRGQLSQSDYEKPHWAKLRDWLGQVDEDQMEELSRKVDHDLANQAITYTVHGDADEERTWDLDPLPFLLDYSEWQGIERALDQRARCLNTLLADAYGPQKSIASGLIPDEYVFEHHGFLRACHGWQPPHNIYLHCYAADIVRSQDGQWRVLQDRCQSPLGLGYALQNRFVIAETMPNFYQQAEVGRVRQFFQQIDRSLRSLCRKTNPHIAIIASNVYGDNAYEQAFLARYLGYDLVDGQDLTVRGGRCYIKKIGGLRQVDLLFRFVDDSWCDPLAFRPDSLLGVPGLARVAAQGGVVVANALGSGLFDSPVIRPLIAPACQQLLGEQALIQGLPAQWYAREQMSIVGADGIDSIEQIKEFSVIKKTWSSQRSLPHFLQEMNLEEKTQLQQKIAQYPAQYCAEGSVEAGLAPVWEAGHIQHKPCSLRIFMVRDGDHYRAMPSALVRVANHADHLHMGARHGGGSKDCWVVGSPPDPIADALPVMPSIPVNRDSVVLSSSRCDDLYWLGRYVERIEYMSRLIRVVGALHDDWIRGERTNLPQSCYYLCERIGIELHNKNAVQIGQEIQKALHHKNGIMAQEVRALLNVAGRTHHLLSQDLWVQLQRLRDAVQKGHHYQDTERIVLLCSAASGSISENMIRDDAWRFVELGRRIQRGNSLGHLLSTIALENMKESDLENILKITDTRIIYRARYRAAITMNLLVDLVAHDETNPRSLSFQIRVIGTLLEDLPHPAQGIAVVQEAYAVVQECMQGLRNLGVEQETLQSELLELGQQLQQLNDHIDHCWFSHAHAQSSVDRSQILREDPA